MSISAKTVAELRKKTGAGMMDCKKALQETDGDFEAAVKWLREKGMSAAKKRQEKEATEGRVYITFADDLSAVGIVEVNSETDFVARNEEFLNLTAELSKAAVEKADDADEKGLLNIDSFNLDGLKGLAGKLGENLQLGRAGALTAGENEYLDSYMHPGDQLGVVIKLVGDADALASDETKELAHDLAMQIAAASPLFVRKEEVPRETIDNELEIYKNMMRNEGKPENIIDKIAMGKMNKYYEDYCLLDQLYVKEQKMKVSARIKEASKAAGGDIDVAAFLRFKVGEGK